LGSDVPPWPEISRNKVGVDVVRVFLAITQWQHHTRSVVGKNVVIAILKLVEFLVGSI
jgi:hypothetical protein